MGHEGEDTAKMIYLISLTGLPTNIRFRQARKLFKDARHQGIVYYVRHFPYEENKIINIQEVLAEVYSKSDAEKLVALLCQKTYISSDNIFYPCKAIIKSTCEMCNTKNPRLINKQHNIAECNKIKSQNQDKLLPISKLTTKLPMLPKFKIQRKILMDEMDGLIKKHCHKHKPLFVRTFCVQIQMRLSQLFEGMNLEEVNSIPTSDVLKMYRKVYNKSTDERFVIDTYELIQLACWPTTETIKNGLYLEEFEFENEGNTNTNDLVNSSLD